MATKVITSHRFNDIDLRVMKPTRSHRLAITPGILGTVYAVNDQGECRYFDYDYAAAMEFAGLTQARDPRYYHATRACSYIRSGATEANPRVNGAKCIWITKEA